ncbi:cadherin domain-containing protein [Microvirga mediterraneensis]|uniref:Cadherin domain-containing protein n=1 Tax=Microvirga mediterraneensis TaxID=2754695 RepID=A0A838BNY7_9HYPH|nr:cadherin domain-containing protein [Microvirga mediterraneensis]MBA1157257.1 cadherin domain-containing protein [Microvirga mediterraneensis]
MAIQTTTPTDGDDIYLIAENQVAGGSFDGKLGNDTLQLTGNTSSGTALSFDFTSATLLSGFETIRGSTSTDYITLSSSQLASISTYDSGGDGYIDFLQIRGTTIDLRDKAIIGPIQISPVTSSATVTVNSKALAEKIYGRHAPGMHLILEGVTLTAAERQTLHNKGIDNITDASGVTSTDTAPQLSGIGGDITTIQAGQTYHVDIGQNAVITEDHTLSSMNIELDNFFDANAMLDIDTAGNVDLVPTNFNEKVFVNSIEIGTVTRITWASEFRFSFNASATPALVQELIRAVTFKYNGSAMPFGSNEVSVEVIDSGNRSAKSKFTLAYQNNAPTDLTLSQATVAENTRSGTQMGKITASDPNEGDRMNFSLLDDAGGRFSLGWDGTLFVKDAGKLDYEQAHSHTIRVKATDRGGLTIEKSFVITLTDVAEDGTSGPDQPIADRMTIRGSAKKDILKGTVADEIIFGGLSNDTLTGGLGRDIFVFDSKPGTAATDRKVNFDKITDFNVNDDSIWLDNKYFTKLGKGTLAQPGKLTAKFFSVGDHSKNKSNYLIYNKKTGVLSYDADGSGSKLAVEIAILKKGLSLTSQHFFVI